jgi:mono/diheme cytochrome c family protein
MRSLLVTLVGAALATTVVTAQAPDPAKVAAGLKAFTTQKCATCHAIAGKGNKSSPLDGVGAKLSQADIHAWLTDPASMEAKLAKKPAMSMASWMKTHKLKDADVDALTAYMMSLK